MILFTIAHMLCLRAALCALLLFSPLCPQTAAAQRHRATAHRPQVRARSIRSAVDAILKTDPAFARAHIGIEIADANTGNILYSLNPDQLFVPASNEKLLTTTAAFSVLGADWKTRTTVESAQPIASNGDLDSDLVLVGRGDPNISGRVLPYNSKTERTPPTLKALEYLADQLVAAGLKRVKGDVLGDDTWFAYERWGDSWGVDDLMWEYAAPVSAMAVNDDVMFFTVTPGASAGAPVTISADPLAGDYVLDSHAVTVAANAPRHFGVDRQPGSRTFKLWGEVPLGSQPQSIAVSIEDPAAFAASSFRNMLVARGVHVEGTARPQHTDPTSLPIDLPDTIVATAPQSQPVAFTTTRNILATLESHALSDDLKVINKVSQNLHVEILMRQLGRAASPYPNSATGGSIYGGTNVVRRFLTNTVGLAPGSFRYEDGSGMSPHDLVTPATLVQLLRWARGQAWYPLFYDTLPVAGVDGTLAHRYVGTPSAGRVHAKTGSLTEVAALSGYATRLNGEEVVFSVLVNASTADKVATRLIDPIVRAVVESGGR